MLRLIKNHFFDYGWLMPAFFPITISLGKAPEHIYLGLYAAWGCFALCQRGDYGVLSCPLPPGGGGLGRGVSEHLQKKWLYVFLGVMIAFGLSALAAQNASLVFQKWLSVSSHMIVFIFVLVVVGSCDRTDEKMRQLLFYTGAGGIVGLLGLYIKLLLSVKKPDFVPNNDMVEDYLPFLMPFMLFFIGNLPLKQVVKWMLSGILLGMVGFYVYYSDGRAALLGLCLSLLIYGTLVLRWRLYQIFLIVGVVLAVVIAINPERFTRSSLGEHTLINKIGAFTSGRSDIWLNGLHHRPTSLLTGIGMGHLKHTPGLAASVRTGEIRDFHNFILNVGYETGLLGLTALLVFIFWPIVYALRRWRQLDQNTQKRLGVLLSASVAILAAGLLTPSHRSIPFTLYLPLFLAGMIVCARRETAK